MLKIGIALLGALAIASAAWANDYAGAHLDSKMSYGQHLVVFNFYLTSQLDSVGPKTTVTFTDCKAGQGLPVGLEPEGFGKNAGSLAPAQDALLVWTVGSTPARHAKKPAWLKLVYQRPHNVRPSTMCLHAAISQQLPKAAGQDPKDATLKVDQDIILPLHPYVP